MNKHSLLLPLLIGLSILSACQPTKKRCSRSYDLEHPISVYPIKAHYEIGATIWFEMNFSDVFVALITNNITGKQFNETITLRNSDFHRNFLRVLKLSDTTTYINAQETGTWAACFDPIYVTGNFIQELPDGPEYKLHYENGYYKLKQGLILKQSGTFLFYPKFKHYYNMACLGSLNEQDITPECEKEMIMDIRFPVNKQANGTHLTNFHLLEQLFSPILDNDPIRIKQECFTFIVD